MFPHCVPLVISVSDRGYDFHAFAPAPPAPSETATVAATAATSPMPTTALFVRIAMTLISLLWSIGLDAVAGAAPAAGTRSRSPDSRFLLRLDARAGGNVPGTVNRSWRRLQGDFSAYLHSCMKRACF